MSARINYQICIHCVMDSSDPEIAFDESGVCHHCRGYAADEKRLPRNRPNAPQLLAELIESIRRRGEGRRYDCLIGLSGGVDSSYVAWYVKRELNLRPLALHLDNGWNSELATDNIERIVTALDIDLVTKVLDWEEFRSLQLAFLKASTPDSEIPTDHAIRAALFSTAGRERIPTIIAGSNFTTERIAPRAWSQGHGDWIYIKSLNRLFGSIAPLRSYPHTTRAQALYRRWFSGLNRVKLLDFLPFDKAKAQTILQQHLGWREYGGKHHESVYTKFFQAYLLPTKFGIDKRRAHLSNLICAGQVTRDDALRQLQSPPMLPDEAVELRSFVAKKLAISTAELDAIVALPVKSYADYPNQYNRVDYRFARAVYRVVVKPLLRRAG
jgi:N-acetyl sugar amidotransferase